MISFLTGLRALIFQVWFWLVQLVPFTAAFFLLDTETFAKITLLYLGEVTIITAALGALSSYVAEKVAVKQETDADVKDVLDAVQALESPAPDGQSPE